MKLLVDMNLSPARIGFLAAAEIEAAHWSSLGPANAPDSAIFAFAAQHGWAVLTHDLDFSAILAASSSDKPSVVQIRAADLNIDAIGPIVLAALRQMEAELTAGALLTIDPKRTRARLLPLPSRH